ncbi:MULTISPECIES: hypothetical protein [unclassified Streptomyces]|uniref:hypothetical protein n=1 Tax=unclassified Streptomyces TaxID=2593676 RepID=UPI002474561E|nr:MULTISPECIES: hypothetical protein [unclassified Streptomyces]MDH6565876.1 hypothetical protein [Streptomyces sp. SAI-117]
MSRAGCLTAGQVNGQGASTVSFPPTGPSQGTVSNGTRMVLWSCNGQADQKWTLN